jgi:hypothetical protein
VLEWQDAYPSARVSSLCASNDEQNHEFAMTRILPTIATVASLDDVLAALG